MEDQGVTVAQKKDRAVPVRLHLGAAPLLADLPHVDFFRAGFLGIGWKEADEVARDLHLFPLRHEFLAWRWGGDLLFQVLCDRPGRQQTSRAGPMAVGPAENRGAVVLIRVLEQE